jgi:hypothetical protein
MRGFISGLSLALGWTKSCSSLLYIASLLLLISPAHISMPTTALVFQDVTTINYTLEWPHLENPSNTTFAGPTQIDICKCGPYNTNLGHMYTRYTCERPEIRFSSSEDELWVLEAPLGQVNLLRPGNDEEVQRRKEVGEEADPSAYAGKNFLLLTGPCPRGRYQAYATLQFLKSLSPLARQRVEYLSLLLQPYEEDCCDDQGGRAYLALARYILAELPAFKTLCLNIWGEETRVGSREFAMLLWKYGITITISWDWWSGEAKEYTEAAPFLEGIDTGVVMKRPVWEDEGTQRLEDGHSDRDYEGHEGMSSEPRHSSDQKHREHKRATARWEEMYSDEEELKDTNSNEEYEHDGDIQDDQVQHGSEDEAEPTPAVEAGDEEGLIRDANIPLFEISGSEDGWSDTMFTPLTPHGGDENDNGSWHVL